MYIAKLYAYMYMYISVCVYMHNITYMCVEVMYLYNVLQHITMYVVDKYMYMYIHV